LIQRNEVKLDIQKVPLKDKIASSLMQSIIEGEIRVGEKLREAHLAKAFGVSQAPVREAIITLVAQGILEHTPNVGTHVKAYSKDEIIEIYEAREALELYAVESMKKDSSLDLMKEEYAQMLKAAKAKDIQLLVKHDQLFHEVLLSACDNCLIMKLWREQYTKSSVFNVIQGFEASLEDIVLMHMPIIEAMEQKSIDKCKDAVHHHYDVIITNEGNTMAHINVFALGQ